ncbi:MAG: hypothetical protein ACYDEF_05785 [Methanosarcina sp.]|nr:hypothetical protein BGV40_07765 [Methanosarcina sp. Ant1]
MEIILCMDQLDKKVTLNINPEGNYEINPEGNYKINPEGTIKSTHTGKQSEKSLGVMLFPMEGSYEYVKTI